ncbi:MAG: rplA [Candidatus Doudnabacteria bacterium]|nr:rplA [Candidatus Doudnabacteria bacterium]
MWERRLIIATRGPLSRKDDMSKITKRQKANSEQVDRTKFYSPEEAIALAKKTANTKFNGSIEVHIRLGIDPKKTDQSVRGSITLPNGTGKTKKIAAFVTETNEKAAKEAGASIVGGEELIKSIKESEKTDFEVAVAEPAMMAKMASIAKILGQRGLMPNPKNGTVTTDIAGAIKEISAGKVNFKNDDSGNIHQIIGKANFEEPKLIENLKTFIDALNGSKPSTVKKQFVMTITVNSSMGPGIKVKM